MNIKELKQFSILNLYQSLQSNIPKPKQQSKTNENLKIKRNLEVH